MACAPVFRAAHSTRTACARDQIKEGVDPSARFYLRRSGSPDDRAQCGCTAGSRLRNAPTIGRRCVPGIWRGVRSPRARTLSAAEMSASSGQSARAAVGRSVRPLMGAMPRGPMQQPTPTWPSRNATDGTAAGEGSKRRPPRRGGFRTRAATTRASVETVHHPSIWRKVGLLTLRRLTAGAKASASARQGRRVLGLGNRSFRDDTSGRHSLLPSSPLSPIRRRRGARGSADPAASIVTHYRTSVDG